MSLASAGYGHAKGGTRTHTAVRPPAPKTGASASSATFALSWLSRLAQAFEPRAAAWAYLLYLLLGLALYKAIFVIQPLDFDNLYILGLVHDRPLSDILRGDPWIFPEWRPLAFFTVWVEYRLLQLAGVPVHFLVNLLLWTSCAWLVYRIVHQLTAHHGAAFLAGMFLYFDRRSSEALTWIVERQTLMACMFGLAAVLVKLRSSEDATRFTKPAIALLLLASALSKEYGVAFALAFVAHGVLTGRRRLVMPAMAAIGSYALLRVVVAGGALATFCEDMGFFWSSAKHCLEPANPLALPQMVYNAGASALAATMSGLFNGEGEISLVPHRIGISLVFIALGVLGLRRGDAVIRVAALLPLTTGVMNLMLYRPRNQLIGVAGLAICAGAGMAVLRVREMPRWHPRLRAAAALLICLLLARKAYDARARVIEQVIDINGQEPCESGVLERRIGQQITPLIKRHYGLPNPDCRATPAAFH
jgi:hypothetical protein